MEIRIDVKAFFEKCRRLNARINGCMEEQMHWRYLRQRVTASYSGMPGGGGAHSSVEDTVQKIFDMEERINSDIDALLEMKKVAQTIIELFSDDRYRDIIVFRYFNMRSWREIAKAMNYDERQVFRLHNCALGEAQAIMAASEPIRRAVQAACRPTSETNGAPVARCQ